MWSHGRVVRKAGSGPHPSLRFQPGAKSALVARKFFVWTKKTRPSSILRSAMISSLGAHSRRGETQCKQLKPIRNFDEG
jgi:hypothetical protein